MNDQRKIGTQIFRLRFASSIERDFDRPIPFPQRF
jgi:hypothetical protein